jgi:hypothetical protein
MGLIEALEALSEWAAGGPKMNVPASGNEPTDEVAARRKKEAEIVAQNEAALAELRKMMPGLI